MAEWLPLFPLEEVVLFPGVAIPLRVFEDRYVAMVRRVLDGDRRFGMVLIRAGSEVGEPAEPYDVGCVARIEELREVGGQYLLIAGGLERFRLLATRREGALLVGRVEPVHDDPEPSDELAALAAEVAQRAQSYFELLHPLSAGALRPMAFPADPITLSFAVAFGLRRPATERQELLELTSSRERLTRLRGLLVSETAIIAERLREREAALRIAVTNGKPPPGAFGAPPTEG